MARKRGIGSKGAWLDIAEDPYYVPIEEWSPPDPGDTKFITGAHLFPSDEEIARRLAEWERKQAEEEELRRQKQEADEKRSKNPYGSAVSGNHRDFFGDQGEAPPPEMPLDLDKWREENEEAQRRQRGKEKADKGGNASATAKEKFKKDGPCATLKMSKAMGEKQFGAGEYPDGEIGFWNDMLDADNPKIPEDLKKKIRAWNGARNRAKEINNRGGELNWERLVKDWENDEIDIGEMINDTINAFGDWVLLDLLIDTAINELTTGVPLITPEFDAIKFLLKVADDTSKNPLQRNAMGWLLQQFGITLSANIFRDVFANMYESILAFARMAKGKKGYFGKEYEGMSDREYLKALMGKTWNAEGNLMQSQWVANGFEDYAYYEMVGAWMEWYRKNDKKYNEEGGGSYKDRCKELDDNSKEKLDKKKNGIMDAIMQWSRPTGSTSETPASGGLSGIGGGSKGIGGG